MFCVSWGWVLEEGERTLRRESHSQIKEKGSKQEAHVLLHQVTHRAIFLAMPKSFSKSGPMFFLLLCPQVVLNRLSVKSAA